jgi:hypothetical protein
VYSALLRDIGRFDIVYSWGVLHHTGAMWQALGNVIALVRENGTLFVSIYNDQGTASIRWRRMKQLYNRTPRSLRFVLEGACFVKLWWRRLLKDALRGNPLQAWRTYSSRRGMSLWTDIVDWVGGYPFEVAKPEDVFRFCRARGFVLQQLTTNGGSLGCNQYVFLKATIDGQGSRQLAPGRASRGED